MKLSDMTNEQLDYWVAKAQGWADNSYGEWWLPNGAFQALIKEYHPSTNWEQAGELVEKFKVNVYWEDDCWGAEAEELQTEIAPSYFSIPEQTADTPTRAICLAVIASVFGSEGNEDG